MWMAHIRDGYRNVARERIPTRIHQVALVGEDCHPSSHNALNKKRVISFLSFVF